MSARRRIPGSDTGDSAVLLTPEHAAIDLSFEEEDDKYKKRGPIVPALTSGTSWGFPSTSNFTKHLSSFTASAINNINQTITANTAPVPNLPPSESSSSLDQLLLSRRDAEDEIVVMASRDRTNEFANAIRSMQGRNIQRAVNIRDPRKAKQMQSYSEFMGVAKLVGRNIASTYTKLEKLTLRKGNLLLRNTKISLKQNLLSVASKKSLFDDRSAEIQELTYIVKGDLNSLNQQIAKLQDISKSQRKNNTGKHLLSHSSNMVVALQAKLANMSNDFKQILEVRTENLKHQKTRRDQFSQGTVMPTSVRGSQAAQGNLLLLEQDHAQSSSGSVTIDFGGASQPLLPPQQQQQQQMMLYDESDQYVQERAETMQNIESTIVELGGIFQQLAHMVKEQEEMVERIDSNVQDTELNIEAAHTEILKYFQSVSKNRWLMIKIFGVLIFFFLFFVMFMT